jgi:hypothetical protein
MCVSLTDGSKWNKYLLNRGNEVILKTSNFSKDFGEFKNSIHVIEKQDSSLSIYSVFADGIGLVYQENTVIDYCQTTPDCIGKSLISSG